MPSSHRFTLEEVIIGDTPAAWEKAGFTVRTPQEPAGASTLDAQRGERPTLGVVAIGGVRIRLVGEDGPRGIEGWTLTRNDDLPLDLKAASSGFGLEPIPGAPAPTDLASHGGGSNFEVGSLDGLPTVWPRRSGHVSTDSADDHPNRATAIDHVVVMTPDVDRTIDAAESIGMSVRRTVDTEANGTPMRQTFFVLHTALLELVGPLEATGSGPSVFFGLAISTPNLPGLDKLLGDGVGPARPAVQPDRQVRTARAKAFGLSFPLLFMSPRPETLNRDLRRRSR